MHHSTTRLIVTHALHQWHLPTAPKQMPGHHSTNGTTMRHNRWDDRRTRQTRQRYKGMTCSTTQWGNGDGATCCLLLHDCHQCHQLATRGPMGRCANVVHRMTPWRGWWRECHQCHQHVPMQPAPIAITMQKEQSVALHCVNNGKVTKGQKGAEQAIGGAALCGQRQGETARGNAGQRGTQDHHQQDGGSKISKRGGHALLHCWWFPNSEWKHVWNALQQNCVS